MSTKSKQCSKMKLMISSLGQENNRVNLKYIIMPETKDEPTGEWDHMKRGRPHSRLILSKCRTV